ncbi:MAG: HAMP domain-containing histidine kinase, partial [Chloroflexales bacterium]|nr:HAMP domain-containing histidine kinase [Chloroflexales bacterium]
LLDRSRALGALELPLSERGLAEVRGGTPWSEAVSLEGVRLLVHSRALRKGGQLVGIIQSARSLDEHDRSLAVLTTALAAGAALGSLLAFGSSWLLVGAALRPIDRITQEAAEIGAEQDFTRRVSYAGPSDEVGRLAATINGMLTELHAGYRQVAQALQTQRRFVADASHELRTPLTTVRGNLDLLGREPPITPQDRRAVLRDTVDETQRMMRLVNELLALARGDAGWRPALSSVPVADLLEEVRRQALVMAPTRPVAIAADEGLCVYASRDQLKQVLLILLDNALKHTPAEASVRLTARAEGDGAAISVADTGPGIEPALMPQLFERFFRADGARTGDGAGLGLSIARSLSEAQGGSIAVESRVGEGSVFTVRLNTLAPQPALPWPTATGEGEPETLPPPSPVHVASGGGGQGE